MKAQKLSSEVYLNGEKPPTRQQVSVVLHALADHTLAAHLVSAEVRKIGADRAYLGEDWERASGIGRFFQKMGNALDRSLNTESTDD